MYNRSIYYPPVIDELRTAFLNDRLQLKADHQIVFLFGAKSEKNKISVRDTFYKYVTENLLDYQFLLAEVFFNLYTNNSKIDLLTLERKLADYTDCIIIIVESPGAIAELGAFTHETFLATKILAINEKKFEDSDSFISLGPIAKLKKKSKFGVFFANFDHILSTIDKIEASLEKNSRKNSKSININSAKDFNSQKQKKIKLLILSDLITIFNPIASSEMIEVVKRIFDYDKSFVLDEELALLETLGFIKKRDDYYIKSKERNFFFFKLKRGNIYDMRYKIFNHYSKHFSKRIELIANDY